MVSKLSEIWLFIPDPDCLPILKPVSRGHKVTGSGSVTLEKRRCVTPVEEAGDENGEEQHGDDDESGHEEGEDVLLVGDQQRELRLLRRF